MEQLNGYTLLFSPSSETKVISTWTFSLPAQSQIIQHIKPYHGPIASLGRVTAERGTYYKYLNPHLNAILIASPLISETAQIQQRCGVYIVDVVSGSIIYHSSFQTTKCGEVNVELLDYALIYTYWKDGEGQMMVSVEIYEGDTVDGKTKRCHIKFFSFLPLVLTRPYSAEMSSFSSEMAKVQVFEQSYILPETGSVTAMKMTSTKFGMASKDLISMSTFFHS